MELSSKLRGAVLMIEKYAELDSEPAEHKAAVDLLQKMVEAATPDRTVPLTWTQLGRPSEPLWALRDCGLISGRSGAYELHTSALLEWAQQLQPKTDWPLRQQARRGYPRPRGWHRWQRRRTKYSAAYRRWYAEIAAERGWPRP